MADGLTALFTAIAAAAAIYAAVVAARAHGTSATANTVARDANTVARDARDAADEANKIAQEANKISNLAVQDARDARVEVIWHNMLKAVNRFLNFHPGREDIGPPLTELRVSAMLLGDETDVPKLDEWLAQEQVLVPAIARECLTRLEKNPPRSAEEEFELIAPLSKWATVYISNLRYARKRGRDAIDEIAQLKEAAAEQQREIFARNGWGTPPEGWEGVGPLTPPS